MNYLNSTRAGCLLLLAAHSAFPSLIPVGPVMLDRNIGLFQPILAIQGGDSASGCVGFLDGETITGLSACPGGFSGAGGNEVLDPVKTASPSIGQLSAMGITNPADLLFVLNSGEPAGGRLTINELTLTFLDDGGISSFTTMLLGTPLMLPDVGTGPQAGFAFRLDDIQASLAASFFTNSNNRLGAAATISGASGVEQRLFLAPVQAQVAVPEPAAIFLVCSGLAALERLRKRAA